MSSMLPGEGKVVKRCETAKQNGSEGNEHRTTLGESRNSAGESEGGLESTSWRHSKSRMPQQTCICNICMHFLLVFFSMFLCIFHFSFSVGFPVSSSLACPDFPPGTLEVGEAHVAKRRQCLGQNVVLCQIRFKKIKTTHSNESNDSNTNSKRVRHSSH